MKPLNPDDIWRKFAPPGHENDLAELREKYQWVAKVEKAMRTLARIKKARFYNSLCRGLRNLQTGNQDMTHAAAWAFRNKWRYRTMEQIYADMGKFPEDWTANPHDHVFNSDQTINMADCATDAILAGPEGPEALLPGS